tara:strand:- start:958 stop:1092 length:135 start_codon:yes stop_codon:yes gene_type:complete
MLINPGVKMEEETMTDTLSELDLFEDIDLIIYDSEIIREVNNEN